MRGFLNVRIVTVASIVLAALALGEAAHALSGAAFRYTTPKTGYLMLPAAAFTPQSDVIVYGNSGAALNTTGNKCFNAPVNLPQGAKITQFAMWYLKNDTADTSGQLVRLSPPDFTAANVAVVVPPTSSGTIRSAVVNVTDPSLQTVNNARYAYYALQCLSDQETLISTRIRYTYKTAGD